MEQLEGYISSEAQGSGKICIEYKHFFPPLLAFHFRFFKCLSHGCSWEKFLFFFPEPAVQSSFSKYIINEVYEPSGCETHFFLLVLVLFSF